MHSKILVAAGVALVLGGPAAAQLPGIDAPTGAAADTSRRPDGEAKPPASRSNADADVTRRGTTSDETARNRTAPKQPGVGGGPSLDAKVEGSGPVIESGVGSADRSSGAGAGRGPAK